MAGVKVILKSSNYAGGSGSDAFNATTPSAASSVTLTNQAVLFQGVTDPSSGTALPDRVVPFSDIAAIVST